MNDSFQATVDALCAEMVRWQARLADREFTTIFLGGGTPTLLSDALLAQLFEGIHNNFRVATNAEITSEANPGTVDSEKFATLRRLGANRLSLGVQSFQPDELHFLERIHDVDDVYRAVERARIAGFDNLNLDFIFGLPGQSDEDWNNTLDQAFDLQPEHLSLYSLIVEPNTPLFHWVKTNKVQVPDEDRAGELYELAQQRMTEAGYQHYEVSNWAKTPEQQSQHNLIYWRNQEYLGIGPGAHSHLCLPDETGTVRNRRWGNRKAVPGYINRIQRGASVEEFCEVLEPRESMGETMMLGLRLVQEGVPHEHFAQLHGEPLETVFAKEVTRLTDQGLLVRNDQQVRLSNRGLLLGNQVFMQFLP